METLSLKRQGSTNNSAGGTGKASSAAWLLVLFLAGVGLSACRSKTTDLKDDLRLYIGKANAWVVTEAQVNSAIVKVRRDHFVHDDLLLETLTPIEKTVWSLVQELEQYQPHSPPLLNVHHEYTEAWRAHYFALTAMTIAAERKDYVQLAKANKDLQEAQRSLANALSDLARLLRGTGLERENPLKDQPLTADEQSPSF
jgi:hypothetical protein